MHQACFVSKFDLIENIFGRFTVSCKLNPKINTIFYITNEKKFFKNYT